MNTARSVLLAGSLLAVATFLPATAKADSGFYVGAGVGNASFEVDLVDAGIPEFPGFDESDLGFKAFAGYNFDLPVVSLGLEAGYTDFGNPSMSIEGQSLDISLDGLTLWGIAAIGLGPVDLYGKVGSLQWDATISALDDSESADGSETGYGIGLRFNAGSLQLRGEYEIFELDGEADLTMFSLGVAYNF